MTKRDILIYQDRIRYMLNHTFDKYRSAQEIAGWAGITETSDTCPITRGFIREMIEGGELIGSTSKGYYIMTTGKEVQKCLNSLLRRQMGISRRIQSIYGAAQAKGIL